MSKTDTALGNYIDSDAPSKVNPHRVAAKAYKQAVQRESTAKTLFILAGKHKVALLAIGNIVLVLNYVFPEWTTLVGSLI